uniref:Uncharacterized protein n=1 Tax=Rattus norvegicus TaxID=10116 RepID=Q63174_RAT|nr:unknown protein [Rattus norvegicus]
MQGREANSSSVLPCLAGELGETRSCSRSQFPAQLNGLKTEDRKLRDCSAIGVEGLSRQVTELTNNFIYKSHPSCCLPTCVPFL